MPNPQTGIGANVTLGLQKFSWAMYMAAATASAAVYPPAKLLATEPAVPWVRAGRLKEDQFSWNIPAPSMLEGRAGFTGTLKYYVVKQAELPKLTVPMDESDPDALNRLRGGAASAATSLSSGVYTGFQFIYQAGKVYNCRVLLIGSDITGGQAGANTGGERHIAAYNSYLTFKPVSNPDSEGVEAEITMGADNNNYAFYLNNWV